LQDKRKALPYNQKVEMFSEIQWQQLTIGDVVWLRQGEPAPADLLILETQNEILFQLESGLTGQSEAVPRNCPSVTLIPQNSQIKNCFFDYRRILSGSIQYSASHQYQFEGYIRLNKDLKHEYLNQSHLVLRGASVQFTSWIFGLVLYVGKDCKFY